MQKKCRSNVIKRAYYLAIDQGTHATRSVLFDNEGILVDIEWREISLNRLDETRVEQNALEILQSVMDCITTILNRQPSNIHASIAACGISTQRSTVVACMEDGTAISPALSWQDVRGQQYLQKLSRHHQEIQTTTGLPVSAHYGASKFHWLNNQFSGQSDIRLAPLVSYLLTNILESPIFVVDHSNAQRTLLMDLSTLNWSEPLCRWFDIPENKLPLCKPMLSHYGELHNTGIPVNAVCGDQNAAIFGMGSIPETDTAIINLGSGAFILRTIEKNNSCESLLTGVAYSDSRQTRYLREGTVNGAGVALSWVMETYAIENLYDHLPKWLEKIIDPPIFINTIGNLGSPWWRQDIQAEFLNADMQNKPALVVAVVESILFLLMDNFLRMQAENPINNIRVSGGLSQLDGLCQKIANLMQLPVSRFDTAEATARGCAWLAAGMPEHWELEPDITFTPKYDSQLKDRYATFQTELKKRLSNAKANRIIPELVAHRGYMNNYPENTRVGLEAALKAGAPYIEFDIQLNNDHEFIVIHDSDLKRTAGIDASVFDLSTQALKNISVHEPERFQKKFYPEQVPSLVDILSLLKKYPASKAMIEIKEESLEKWGVKQVMKKLHDALENHQDQCIVISFDHNAIAYTQKNSILKTGWVLHQYNQQHEQIARRLQADYLICNYRKIPDKEPLWSGHWQWMLYDICDPQLAMKLAKRGVAIIETAEIAGMLSHPDLHSKAITNPKDGE